MVNFCEWIRIGGPTKPCRSYGLCSVLPFLPSSQRYHQVKTFSDGTEVNNCGTIEYRANKNVYEVDCGFERADQIEIRQDNDYLTLCEVEVYGEPSKFTLGTIQDVRTSAV